MSGFHTHPGPDDPPLPDSYPDPDVVTWLRWADIEYLGLPIRMTVIPGERVIELWELVDKHPVRWMGNVFRIEAIVPLLYLNHKYEQAIPRRAQRDALARIAADFWKS
jgi:hypothetical protein